MSKHKNKCCCCNCYSNYPGRNYGCGGNYGGRKSSNGLLILILILLQFRCRGAHHHCGDGDHDYCRSSACEVDNSVLFIIALYYLSCCNNFSLCCSGC